MVDIDVGFGVELIFAKVFGARLRNSPSGKVPSAQQPIPAPHRAALPRYQPFAGRRDLAEGRFVKGAQFAAVQAEREEVVKLFKSLDGGIDRRFRIGDALAGGYQDKAFQDSCVDDASVPPAYALLGYTLPAASVPHLIRALFFC